MKDLTYRTVVFNKLTRLIDHHLGSFIEEVAEKYYRKEIDLEIEYEDLLRFITKRLLEDPVEYSEEEFKKVLRELTSETSVCKLIISYLLSEYIRENIKNEINDIDIDIDIEDDDDDVETSFDF